MPKQAETQLHTMAGPEGQLQKKKKKKKDRGSKLQQPESAPGTTANGSVPDAQPVMDAAASLKAEKRLLKKARRLQAAAAAQQEQAVSMPAAEPEAQAPPKKKRKQGGAPAGGEAQASMAEVGDRELARSGKPIRKALYSEAPAVAAMSGAEVDAWREARSTVVAGCDIRPVPAFEHAGACTSFHTVLPMQLTRKAFICILCLHRMGCLYPHGLRALGESRYLLYLNKHCA